MERNIIIFDFEVFKYDTLLGAKIIGTDGSVTNYQTWDLQEIIDFYNANTHSIWVGHNNSYYDNIIMQEVVRNKTSSQIKQTSDDMIKRNKRKWCNIQLYSYDIMSTYMVGLKAIECTVGKDISFSLVDFELDRPLTSDEKLLTESYNNDDLSQTFDNFYYTISEFTLRLDVIKEFDLPMSAISSTGTQLAEMVLKANKVPGIADWYIPPQMYPNLHLKNKKVLEFYKTEAFRQRKSLTLDLCGTPHKLGAGGIHGALNKYHADWSYYFDVSGYYNLVMILYDLLPRSIPKESEELYEYMYEAQLRLKKTDPNKRWVYKVILLSVFGAMTNEHCKFYDPNRGTLVTMVGQLFLVDLLEKLDGKVVIVQSNTDGIIAKGLDGVSDDEILGIINEWQERTGFSLKLEKIYDVHQRDVNCYMYRTEDGEIVTRGEAAKHYNAWENPFYEASYKAREPIIIEHAIVDYFMFNKLPEQTIEENKDKLRMFQFVCRKMSFDWMELETLDIETGEKTVSKLDSVCRAFSYNNSDVVQCVYKRKHRGKTTKSRIASTPQNMFVYNHEILSKDAIAEVHKHIDFQYYIDRSYEKILTFKDFDTIKDFCI